MQTAEITSEFLPGGALSLRIPRGHAAYAQMAALLAGANSRHARLCQQQAVQMSAAAAAAQEEVPGDAFRDLCQLYAATWNALMDQGEEISPHELQSARDELADCSWGLAFKDGKWTVRRRDDEDAVQMSGARAPKGYTRAAPLLLAGHQYIGGMWIPAAVMAQATPEQQAEVEGANAEQAAAAADKRRARGPVDVSALQERLRPHAERHDLLAPENKAHLTSAKRMYAALAREHGDLTAHRIDELAEQAQRALDGLPEEEEGQRDYFARQLSKFHAALEFHKQGGPPGSKSRAQQAAQPWLGKGEPDHGIAYNAPIEHLHIDPARFQYKINVDKAGVTDELKSVETWNPDCAGIISVWKDPADGRTYVINGHHRFELAGRLGVKTLAVRYVDTKDAKAARGVGALINIAGGRGTALDAAKYMRDTGITPQELHTKGISLKGKLAAEAVVLMNLSPQAFDQLARGSIELPTALAVAKHLTDPDRQNLLFARLKSREEEGKSYSPKVIEEMAQRMASVPEGEKGGPSLFGDEGGEPLFEEQAELTAHIRGELGREANDFLAVSSKRRAERVGKAGNVLDVEANKKIAEQAERVKGVFDKLAHRKGPIADALNAATLGYAKAKTKKEKDRVRKEAVESVKQAVFAEAGIGEAQSAGEGSHLPGGAAPAEDGTPAAAAAGPERGNLEPAGLTPPAPPAPAPETVPPVPAPFDKEDKSPLFGKKAFPKGEKLPTDTISSMPGLNDADRAIETKAKEKVLNDWDNLRSEYLAQPGNATRNPDGSLRSVVVNTDEWRPFFDGYVGTNASVVQKPSSFANKKFLAEMVKEQAGKGNKKLAIYAGGGGSGKGSAISQFFTEADYPLRLDQVTDEYQEASDFFDKVKALGYEPEFIFVDRPPADAWSGVVGRALNLRKNNQPARTVPLELAFKANLKARRVALEMLEKRHDIEPNIIDNRAGEPGGRRLIEDRDEAIAYLKERIAADEKEAAGGMESKLHQQILDRFKAGDIPEDIARGFLGNKVIDEAKAKPDALAANTIKEEGQANDRARVPGSAEVPPVDAEGAEPAQAANAGRGELRRTDGVADAGQQAVAAPAGHPEGAAGKAGQEVAAEEKPALHPAMEKFSKFIQDTPAADKAYNALPDTEGGKVINTDTARFLSPEFAAGKGGAIRHSKATAKIASKYAYGRLLRELNNRGERKNLLVLAGGPAAGKSSGLDEGAVDKADLVWDTTLQDSHKSQEAISTAVKNGWQVDVNYVHADPENFVKGMLNRDQRTGRWGKFEGLADTHQKAQANTLALLKSHPDQIKVHLAHNTYDRSQGHEQIKPEDIAPGGKYHLGADTQKKTYEALDKLAPYYNPHMIGLIKGEKNPEDVAKHFEGEDAYLQQAMGNLAKTSRTAGGVVDTSASAGKAAQMAEGLTGAKAAEAATRNFEKVVKGVYHAKDTIGERTPAQLMTYADNLNGHINQGIVKEGVSARTDDSDKFAYTKVADLPLAREQFADELSKRLKDPAADPVETAAWIEWRTNITDHFYADGVGKTAKALAMIPLMKAGLPLPSYPDNKEFYALAPKTPIDPKEGSQAYLGKDWQTFLNYYRTLMPNAEGQADDRARVPEQSTVPPDDAGGAEPERSEADRRGELRRPQGGAATEGESQPGATGHPQGTEAEARQVAGESPPDEPKAAKADYEIKPARYAKGHLAIHAPGNDGLKSRAQRLAENLGGRWSNREKAFIISTTKAEKFKKLFAEGWDGSSFGDRLIPPDKAEPATSEEPAEPAEPTTAPVAESKVADGKQAEPLDIGARNLDFYKEKAAAHKEGMKLSKRFYEKLPEDQRAAVDWYRGGGYRAINKQLRSGQKQPDALEEQQEDHGRAFTNEEAVTHLDKAIDNAPLPRPVVSYRGAQSPREAARLLALNPGEKISDKGFVSSSLSPQYAYWSFAKKGEAASGGQPVLARLELPSGFKAGYVSDDEGVEQELLLHRGAGFEFAGKQEKTDEHGNKYTEVTLRASGAKAEEKPTEPAAAPAAPAKEPIAPADIKAARRQLAAGKLKVHGGAHSEPITSDLSGETIRRHVVLPNGAKVHPDELARAAADEEGNISLSPHEGVEAHDQMGLGGGTHGSFAKAIERVAATPGRDNDRVTLAGPHTPPVQKTRAEWREIAAAAKGKPESMAAWYDRENPEPVSEAAKASEAGPVATQASEKESEGFFAPQAEKPAQGLFGGGTKPLSPDKKLSLRPESKTPAAPAEPHPARKVRDALEKARGGSKAFGGYHQFTQAVAELMASLESESPATIRSIWHDELKGAQKFGNKAEYLKHIRQKIEGAAGATDRPMA